MFSGRHKSHRDRPGSVQAVGGTRALHERTTGLTIRAVVFDISGVLEVVPSGKDPTAGFPDMIAGWEARLGMRPGELDAQIREMDARLSRMGKDGRLGTCSEEEWREELRLATGMDATQLDAFMDDFWDVYLGELNGELVAYFASLRPRYHTALLSNSFVGARSREQQRYHFDEMTDLIMYSHEVGLAKPDPRIFELTCARLGVSPGEMAFLDDAEVHVAAARALGIHAILYRNAAQATADVRACLLAHA
jgi:epoxide hydrolase-like predicted phosphatase